MAFSKRAAANRARDSVECEVAETALTSIMFDPISIACQTTISIVYISISSDGLCQIKSVKTVWPCCKKPRRPAAGHFIQFIEDVYINVLGFSITLFSL